MIRVVLLDYGAGNLRSLARALEAAGAGVTVVAEPAEDDGDVLVLPGVGHFGAAVRRLQQTGLGQWLQERVRGGRPLLGVCLGMQLLYRSSEESPGTSGLSLLDGTVRRLPDGVTVPHMGWNTLRAVRPSALLAGSPDPVHVYYAHSYAVVPPRGPEVVAVTTYGVEFAAVVQRGPVVGLQFHPEKSGPAGVRILARALEVLAGRGTVRVSGR